MNSPSKKRGPNALPMRVQRTMSMRKGALVDQQKAQGSKNQSKVTTSFTASLQPTSLLPSTQKEGEKARMNQTSVQASEQVNDLTDIARRATSPNNVIHHF